MTKKEIILEILIALNKVTTFASLKTPQPLLRYMNEAEEHIKKLDTLDNPAEFKLVFKSFIKDFYKLKENISFDQDWKEDVNDLVSDLMSHSRYLN